jgi:monoamine oxidase
MEFIVGADAPRFARLDPAVRRRDALEAFARAFGRRALQPADYLEHDWQAEHWTRGGYFAHLPPGAWTQVGSALRAPVGRICWAGTETASRWQGYMDGAVEAGLRAALEAQAP